jgi:hypothetical protein
MDRGRPEMEPGRALEPGRPTKEPKRIKRDPERPEMGHVRQMLIFITQKLRFRRARGRICPSLDHTLRAVFV